MAAGRRWILPATGGTVKTGGGGETDERETGVRYSFKYLPPFAVPPPAATTGGVLVLARHVARRCCHRSTAASSCVAAVAPLFLPLLFFTPNSQSEFNPNLYPNS